MLYWVDVKIGVDAETEIEARTKVGRILVDELQEDFNWQVSYTITKDKRFRNLQDLRLEQKKKKE
jgi:hypothetical protein